MSKKYHLIDVDGSKFPVCADRFLDTFLGNRLKKWLKKILQFDLPKSMVLPYHCRVLLGPWWVLGGSWWVLGRSCLGLLGPWWVLLGPAGSLVGP